MPSEYKRTRGWAVGAALLLVAGLALRGPAQAGVNEALMAGCALLGQGRAAAAMTQFNRALADYPRCAEVRVARGAALLGQGLAEPALGEFEAALALAPDLRAAQLGRAGALAQVNRLAEAAAQYAALAEAGGLGAARARAAQAWAVAAQGDYAHAQALVEQLGPAGVSDPLASYVAGAAQLALAPGLATVAAGAPALEAGLVSLAGCLGPSAGGGYGAPLPRVAALQILTPRPGSRVRGPVPLVVRGTPSEPPAATVVTVGGDLAGLGEGLAFPEPLDTAAWPAGAQRLVVAAYNAAGQVVGRGEVSLEVEVGDLTRSEPAETVSPWAVRTLERWLGPQLRPGAWEQLAGRVAWEQGRLPEAQRLLSAAFAADPGQMQIREDLLELSRALGLPVERSAQRLTQVATSQRAVALTFDDGPHPRLTPWILHHLDRFQARATFFLVGKQVRMYPELAREIVARGHEVASHSYSHQNMTGLGALEIERELVGSRAVLAEVTGAQATLFRPPGGNWDGAVSRAASRWGFTSVFWTCNICDFYQNPRDRVVAGMMRQIEPGGIVLLHNGEDLTVEILLPLLEALRSEGYSMLSVSELLATRD